MLGIITTGIILGLFSFACQDETRFANNDSNIQTGNIPFTSDDAVQENVPEVISNEAQVNLYTYGELDKPIDYLFVLDNSPSMNSLINNVNQGFQSLLANDPFPRNSKIAVMNTMIGDPNDFSLITPLDRRYAGMELEPGFLDFVDAASIKNYKDNVAAGFTRPWALDGCKEKWFSPGDKNENGDSCLTAATQFSGRASLEAGITAYEHLLLKHKDNKLFRKGALLNVIFVSDTHDPGRNEPSLITNRKNYAQLNALTNQYQDVRSLKFHAISPARKCSAETLHDFSYHALVDDSKGEKGDVCTLTDYSEYLKAMVQSSTIEEPVFMLNKQPSQIISVVVNDEETGDYTIEEDKMSIRINGLEPGTVYTVRIEYE